MTHTVELNALCMKLGKKPIYKLIDPYQGMRPTFNYNIRAPGPYARSMQQYVQTCVIAVCMFNIRYRDLFLVLKHSKYWFYYIIIVITALYNIEM